MEQAAVQCNILAQGLDDYSETAAACKTETKNLELGGILIAEVLLCTHAGLTLNSGPSCIAWPMAAMRFL